jgi:hypothetical protein
MARERDRRSPDNTPWAREDNSGGRELTPPLPLLLLSLTGDAAAEAAEAEDEEAADEDERGAVFASVAAAAAERVTVDVDSARFAGAAEQRQAEIAAGARRGRVATEAAHRERDSPTTALTVVTVRVSARCILVRASVRMAASSATDRPSAAQVAGSEQGAQRQTSGSGRHREGEHKQAMRMQPHAAHTLSFAQ